MSGSTLFLGYSSIAARRAIPALHSLDPGARLDIASLGRKIAPSDHELGTVYDNYAKALERSPAELVYVSLANSLHCEWAMKALKTGRHVIVDKPAFLSLSEAEAALDLAQKTGRCLAEATVFNYHSQFARIEEFVEAHGPLHCVTMHFIVPPFPIENFRNHQHLGGGALHDMGPYAAAITRLIGGEECPQLAAFQGGKHPDTEVNLGFSMLAAYTGGSRIGGHFSFEGDYANRIGLMGRSASLFVERIFSPPADLQPEWEIWQNNKVTKTFVEADDAFQSFFEALSRAMERGMTDSFAANLHADAKFRERLKTSLGI
jgi:NDP-hexose-3-ketoreductase